MSRSFKLPPLHKLIIGIAISVISVTFVIAADAEASIQTRPATDDVLRRLPASDFIAVFDVDRYLNLLLPKLKGIAPDEFAKVTKEIDDGAAKTGFAIRKIRTVGISLKTEGEARRISTTFIIEGLDIDAVKLKKAVVDDGGKFRMINYRGDTIFEVTPRPGRPGKKGTWINPRGTVLEIEEFALAQMENEYVAVGALSSVKSVLDSRPWSDSNKPNFILNEALKGTDATALIRFAARGSLLKNVGQRFVPMGDIYEQFASIKLILGSIGLTDDFSGRYDVRLRTDTTGDAEELEMNLRTVTGVGRLLFGGSRDPLMQAVSKLFSEENFKVRVDRTDVLLSVMVPKSIMDSFTTLESKTTSLPGSTGTSSRRRAPRGKGRRGQPRH